MNKKIYILIAFVISFILITQNVLANTSTENGITYLKSNQDSFGKITGFGGESEWAAIAFAANGIDISSLKSASSSASLKEFLLNDQPNSSAPVTDWERKTLAISAIGDNPASFGGINYIEKIESFYENSQIGDINLLNDDIFGLLSLIASNSSNAQIKEDVLNFIISHQNSNGGFSWSLTPPFNTSDSNDTAAAIQALQAAKNNGLIATSLDDAITKAKDYLLTAQNSDGGFGYDASSDSDGSSTTWALMALNSLGLFNSTEATSAKVWLTNNQEADGGFHWTAGFGSDTYTTSHSLIALSGKDWTLSAIATSSASTSLNPTATPSATPLPSATPTPQSSPSLVSTPTPTSTPTASVSPTPTVNPTPAPVVLTTIFSPKPSASIKPTLSPQILGTSETFKNVQQNNPFNLSKIFFSLLSAVNLVGAAIYWRLK